MPDITQLISDQSPEVWLLTNYRQLFSHSVNEAVSREQFFKQGGWHLFKHLIIMTMIVNILSNYDVSNIILRTFI